MTITSSISSTLEPKSDPRTAALYEKASELEGVFLNTLVAEMFKGLETDSMFGGGHAEETWRGMMAEQYASDMAKAGGVGLADQIVASLIETQEAVQAAPNAHSMGAIYR